jgi:hypothetical protein
MKAIWNLLQIWIIHTHIYTFDEFATLFQIWHFDVGPKIVFRHWSKIGISTLFQSCMFRPLICTSTFVHKREIGVVPFFIVFDVWNQRVWGIILVSTLVRTEPNRDPEFGVIPYRPIRIYSKKLKSTLVSHTCIICLRPPALRYRSIIESKIIKRYL